MNDIFLDKIRGCLYGGAVGDALGYPVEFLSEKYIRMKFGDAGIQEYKLDTYSAKALISDDTQMTLFTANGVLVCDAKNGLGSSSRELPRHYIAMAYQDWLLTQNEEYPNARKIIKSGRHKSVSWLCDVPELYSRRAPGITCLSALEAHKENSLSIQDYLIEVFNDSKGCGGIMRAAPVALRKRGMSIEELDKEGAEIAAITHSHSLGYMPAAVLVHIINCIVFSKNNKNLKEIVIEARDTVAEIFKGDMHLEELTDIIDLAVSLSENGESDSANIRRIGEGWVAEETLGIAIYCSLRHQNDFTAGITASVNHDGDSDSTGAVTGNILGALLGYDAIEDKWKQDLELSDVILEIAYDLFIACDLNKNEACKDPRWIRKYIDMCV